MLVALYAKTSEMRVISSPDVLAAAEDVVRRLVDTYSKADITFADIELKTLIQDGSFDLLRDFSEFVSRGIRSSPRTEIVNRLQSIRVRARRASCTRYRRASPRFPTAQQLQQLLAVVLAEVNGADKEPRAGSLVRGHLRAQRQHGIERNLSVQAARRARVLSSAFQP